MVFRNDDEMYEYEKRILNNPPPRFFDPRDYGGCYSLYKSACDEYSSVKMAVEERMKEDQWKREEKRQERIFQMNQPPQRQIPYNDFKDDIPQRYYNSMTGNWEDY